MSSSAAAGKTMVPVGLLRRRNTSRSLWLSFSSGFSMGTSWQPQLVPIQGATLVREGARLPTGTFVVNPEDDVKVKARCAVMRAAGMVVSITELVFQMRIERLRQEHLMAEASRTGADTYPDGTGGGYTRSRPRSRRRRRGGDGSPGGDLLPPVFLPAPSCEGMTVLSRPPTWSPLS